MKFLIKCFLLFGFWSKIKLMEKAPLPIKTKIAAWWMIASGFVIILLSLYFYITLSSSPERSLFYRSPSLLFFSPFFLLGLFFIISGNFLFMKKGWVWTIVVVFDSLLCLLGVIWLYQNITSGPAPIGIGKESIFVPLAFVIICALPLILILLDRKNFWKIAI